MRIGSARMRRRRFLRQLRKAHPSVRTWPSSVGGDHCLNVDLTGLYDSDADRTTTLILERTPIELFGSIRFHALFIDPVNKR